MQHLDEGTIHSWLDDALGAEEAARVEAHVTACAECAAKVAEARGFIAASSRILTALDDVPRGVIPIATRKATRFGPAWRAAAAVLVVAGGSMLVLRSDDRGGDAVTAAAPSTAGTESAVARRESATVSIGQSVPMSADAAPVTASPQSSPRSVVTTQPSAVSRPDRLSGTVMESADAAKSADMQRRTADFSGAVAGAVGAAAASPLRLVSDSSGAGSRSFRYAVGVSDTVMLVEFAPLVAQRSATTLTASSPPVEASKTAQANERRTQAPSAPLPAPPPPPAASQVAPTAAAAFRREESAAGVNTLRWVDSASGKTLTLSGKLPVARLEEIRREIEKQRASEKKTP